MTISVRGMFDLSEPVHERALEFALFLKPEHFVLSPGNGARSVRSILVHIVDAERHWVEGVVKGGARERLDPADYPTGETVRDAWRRQRRSTRTLLDELGTAGLAQTRSAPWIEGSDPTIEHILWHVLMHEAHHRGQAMLVARVVSGLEPPETDLL
jgi:uncharacterized damage-inducible protein DinB